MPTTARYVLERADIHATWLHPKAELVRGGSFMALNIRGILTGKENPALRDYNVVLVGEDAIREYHKQSQQQKHDHDM